MAKSADIEAIRSLVQELDTKAAELEKIGDEHDLPMLTAEAERLQESVAILDLQIPRQTVADHRSSPESMSE